MRTLSEIVTLTACAHLAMVNVPRVAFAQNTLPPAPSGQTPQTAISREPASIPSPADGVWVHIEAPGDVRLQQDMTADGGWATVCSAPCDRSLPTAYNYRIVSDGLRPSDDFTLHAAGGGRETVKVHGASKAAYALGMIGLVGGGAVAFVGLVGGYFGWFFSSIGSPRAFPDWVLPVAGVSAGVAAVGFGLVLANKKTTVSRDVGRVKPALRPSNSWKRLPNWKDAAPEQKGLPPAAAMPILGGRF